MSLSQVLTYGRTAMIALQHTEWKDALPTGSEVDNVPSTKLDRAFHIRLGACGPTRQNQTLIELNAPLEVILFVKGYKDTAAGRDRAAGYLTEIITTFLQNDRRIASVASIKNVLFVSGDIKELSSDNDNAFMVVCNFNFQLGLATTS